MATASPLYPPNKPLDHLSCALEPSQKVYTTSSSVSGNLHLFIASFPASLNYTFGTTLDVLGFLSLYFVCRIHVHIQYTYMIEDIDEISSEQNILYSQQ